MTRFLLTLLVFLSISFLASAQFNKGSLLVGGGLSYYDNSNSVNNVTSQTTNSGSINLSLGKAMNENTVFGINLIYSANKQATPEISKGSVYGIGIFYRKYKSLGKDFYLFGEAGAGYNYTDLKSTDNTGVLHDIQSGYGLQVYGTPGIAYHVSKKLFMEISLNQVLAVSYYSTQSNNVNQPQVNSKSSGFSISTSLNATPLSQIGIGFRLMLG